MEQISYYAVIPAFVRYCKDVPDGAKLLYGEITALCNEQGYCWASNKYFSDLYGKSGDTISRWISKLAQAGFILTIVDNQKGNTRKIWLSEAQAYRQKSVDPIGKNADTLTAKIRRPSPQKSVDPIGKNVYPIKENNTFNITMNNTEEGENAQNALAPPFTPAGTIESDEHVEIMLHLLEAEKKEKAPPGSGPTPPTELLVTTHTPQAPYIRVVELVEVPVAPGPKSPGEKIRELCAVNYKIREGFTMSRKIPASKFDEYLAAFDAEKTGLPVPQTWKNDNDLVMNFWAWSEIRYGKEQRNGQPQRQGGGRGAQLQNSGSDMSKYDQPQKF